MTGPDSANRQIIMTRITAFISFIVLHNGRLHMWTKTAHSLKKLVSQINTIQESPVVQHFKFNFFLKKR